MAHRLGQLALIVLLIIIGSTAPAYAMPWMVIAAPLLAALATAVVGAAVSFGLSFVAKALMKPAAPRAAPMDVSVNEIKNKVSVKQPTGAHQIIYGRTRVSGIFGMLNLTQGNQYMSGTLLLSGHLMDGFEAVLINDETLDLDVSGNTISGKYAGNANFGRHLGEPDQQVDYMLNFDQPNVWTVDHRLRGLGYLAFRLRWDNTTGTGNPAEGTYQVSNLGAKLWPGGLPNITCIVRGKLCYDPRTGLTVWTNNSALIVADYLCDQRYGFEVDYATGINEEALIAAANICDETMALAGGGTEKRYTTNGAFLCDEPRDQILGRLLSAMQGRAVYDGERWTIFAGAWLEPADIVLTDDDARKPSSIKGMTSSTDAFNGVKGTFYNPSALYQPADFPSLQSQTFKAIDGGEEAWNDIELPFTTSPSMAQRIAKIQLLSMRQEIAETFPGKLSCWRYLGGTTIKRTSERYGWNEKPFLIDSLSLVFEQDENGNPVVGIDMNLLETAAEVFDWDADEESPIDPAPNTNIPDIFNVLPVTNLRASEFTYVALNGAGVQAAFRLDWDESSDAFVRTGGGYRVKYRLTDTVLWTYLDTTTFISAEVRNVAAGEYIAEVEAINWAGNPSPAVPITFEVVGLSAKPAAPSGFTVAANDSIGYARWTVVDDLDVQMGGNYVMRHSPATDGSATWEAAVSIGEDIPGDANFAIVPLIAGTYLLKARDSTLNYSDAVAAFTQFQTSVHQFELVSGGSSIQDPAFAGVKTNCEVDTGVLRISDGEDEGSYAFDAVMELDSLRLVRLTNIVEVGVINELDDFDARTTESDTWDSWDGAASGNEAETWLMVEWTTDDPGPGRTWNNAQRLHSSSFYMKAARFTRELRRNDPAYNVLIISEAVFAEEVVVSTS